MSPPFTSKPETASTPPERGSDSWYWSNVLAPVGDVMTEGTNTRSAPFGSHSTRVVSSPGPVTDATRPCDNTTTVCGAFACPQRLGEVNVTFEPLFFTDSFEPHPPVTDSSRCLPLITFHASFETWPKRSWTATTSPATSKKVREPSFDDSSTYACATGRGPAAARNCTSSSL
ncbi:hypothetical protein EES43_25535 [Streptomyces sp. ADI96-02]|nr:hypothetical protein EES43_25535 [Streptomyces sp. ADI96-02]